jgi:hypothetical protein
MTVAHKFPKPTVSFDLTTSAARTSSVSPMRDIIRWHPWCTVGRGVEPCVAAAMNERGCVNRPGLILA